MNLDYIMNGKKNNKKKSKNNLSGLMIGSKESNLKSLMISPKNNIIRKPQSQSGLQSSMIKPSKNKNKISIGLNLKPKSNLNSKQGLKSLMMSSNSKNNITNDLMTFKQKKYLNKVKGINRFGDFDKDGVINGLDCQWDNSKKHGFYDKAKKFIKKKISDDKNNNKNETLEKWKRLSELKKKERQSYEQSQADERSYIDALKDKPAEQVKKQIQSKLKSDIWKLEDNKRAEELAIEKSRTSDPEKLKQLNREEAALKGRISQREKYYKKQFEETGKLQKQAIEKYPKARQEQEIKRQEIADERADIYAKGKTLEPYGERKTAAEIIRERAIAKGSYIDYNKQIKDRFAKAGIKGRKSLGKLKEVAKKTKKKLVDYPIQATKEKLIDEGYSNVMGDKVSLTRQLQRKTGYLFSSPEERVRAKVQDLDRLYKEARLKLDQTELEKIERQNKKGEFIISNPIERQERIIQAYKAQEADLAYNERKKRQVRDVEQEQIKRERAEARTGQLVAEYDQARLKYKQFQLNRPRIPFSGSMFSGKQVQAPSLMKFMVGGSFPSEQYIEDKIRARRFAMGEQTVSDEAIYSQYKLNEYMRKPIMAGNYKEALRNVSPFRRTNLGPQGKYDANAPRFMYRKKFSAFTRKTNRLNANKNPEYGEVINPSYNKREASQFPSTRPMKGYERVYVGRGKYIKKGRPKKKKYIKGGFQPTPKRKPKFSKYVRTYGKDAFKSKYDKN